jgi:hypothetical protein
MDEYLYLLNEVKDIMTSNKFLSGYDGMPDIDISINDVLYHRRVLTVEQYLDYISLQNDNNFFTNTDDNIIEPIIKAYLFLNIFLEQQVKYKITLFLDSITLFPRNRDRIEAFIEYATKDKIDFDDYKRFSLHNHFAATISRHIGAIVKARILTLSKRMIPTELILETYKVGLYPFGWQYDNFATLYCLNPFH